MSKSNGEIWHLSLTLSCSPYSNFQDVKVTVLMANAGIAGSTKASEWDGWEKVLATNMYGVINVNQVFLPMIKSHKQASLIINTGSKQGITTPPMTGPAYNASKAVVKVFTEQLAWELRNSEDSKQIKTALLIPGYVWSGLTTYIPQSGGVEGPRIQV